MQPDDCLEKCKTLLRLRQQHPSNIWSYEEIVKKFVKSVWQPGGQCICAIIFDKGRGLMKEDYKKSYRSELKGNISSS
jgi:hypothetical protein